MRCRKESLQISSVEERIFLRVLHVQGILDYHVATTKNHFGIKRRKRMIWTYLAITIHALQFLLNTVQICFNFFVWENYHNQGVALTGFTLLCLCGIFLVIFAHRNYEEISKLTRRILLISKYSKRGNAMRCHLFCGSVNVFLSSCSNAFFWYRHFTNNPIEDYRQNRITIISSEFSIFVWFLSNFLYLIWPAAYHLCIIVLISWKFLLLRSCYENVRSRKWNKIYLFKRIKRLENSFKSLFSNVLLLLLATDVCFTILLTMRVRISGARATHLFFNFGYIFSALCWESSRLEQTVSN